MKTLYIIRHAKSSWQNPLCDDFDRSLNDRGKGDAKLIGKKLHEKKIIPDHVFSSPAKRARKTCKAICDEIGYKFHKVKFDEEIYDNHMDSIDFYLSYIMNFKNKYDSVFIIGHNNAWTELASYLIGKDLGNIPTCGVVCIKFDIDSWEDISHAKGKEEFFIYPKMFKEKEEK